MNEKGSLLASLVMSSCIHPWDEKGNCGAIQNIAALREETEFLYFDKDNTTASSERLLLADSVEKVGLSFHGKKVSA